MQLQRRVWSLSGQRFSTCHVRPLFLSNTIPAFCLHQAFHSSTSPRCARVDGSAKANTCMVSAEAVPLRRIEPAAHASSTHTTIPHRRSLDASTQMVTSRAPAGPRTRQLPREALQKRTSYRLNTAFFLFGLLNNALYVVILTAALELLPQGVPTGLVSFANIFPALIAKAVWPYLLRGRVRYTRRVWSCAALSFVGMLLVSFFPASQCACSYLARIVLVRSGRVDVLATQHTLCAQASKRHARRECSSKCRDRDQLRRRRSRMVC